MPVLDLRALDAVERTRAFEVRGPVSTQGAAELKAALDRHLSSRDLCLILGLREVPYVNSSGVGHLLDLAVELDRRGGGVLLVELPAKIKVMLENLGVTAYFRIEPTLEGARETARAMIEKSRTCPRVVLLTGGTEFPLTGAAIRIGSDPKSTVVVAKADMRHAEIVPSESGCLVRDLGSKSGTWVGDRQVTEEALKTGDVVRVADARLMFVQKP